MDIRLLSDFLAVANSTTLAQAAEQRHVSLSALSRRLTALEDWVGTVLVDRTCRPHKLTSAGWLFQDVAANVVSSLRETRDMLSRELPGQSIITFALPHTLQERFLPGFLESARAAGISFESQLVVGTEAARLREIFEKGACDFLLYYSSDEHPFQLPPRSSSIALSDELLVPVSRPDPNGKPLFPLPGRSDRYTPQFSQGPGSYFMELVALRLRDFGNAPFLKPLPLTEGATPFLDLALQGNGLAWLPMGLVSAHIESGKLMLAGTKDWCIPLKIRLARRPSPLGGRAEALWEALHAKPYSSEADSPTHLGLLGRN